MTPTKHPQYPYTVKYEFVEIIFGSRCMTNGQARFSSKKEMNIFLKDVTNDERRDFKITYAGVE